MTDDNPYDPVWTILTDDAEDSLWKGMRALAYDDEDSGIVVDIREHDVDVNDEGQAYVVTPTRVEVMYNGETEWCTLDEVTFLAHELEYGQKLRAEKRLLRKYSTHGRKNASGYHYYGWKKLYEVDAFLHYADLCLYAYQSTQT